VNAVIREQSTPYARVSDEFSAKPVQVHVWLDTSDGARVRLGSSEIVETKARTSPYQTIYEFATKRTE
jgi:hypothetical protein